LTEETVESFRTKLLRMFFPITPQKSVKRKLDPDLEVTDPLERMENAIRRDAESKGKYRKKSS